MFVCRSIEHLAISFSSSSCQQSVEEIENQLRALSNGWVKRRKEKL
jgi:hypothetical protein